ncbi:MAG: hypothetical protein WKF84_29345 [Pyrinomonadaceae bacterium]
MLPCRRNKYKSGRRKKRTSGTRKQPWLVGSNYNPATAINELEMWQADTFDPERIDLELGWAESIGMNTMRVFLHDLRMKQDAEGFRTASRYNFWRLPRSTTSNRCSCLFDSCWGPVSGTGTASAQPRAGVHNSGWVQSVLARRPCRTQSNIRDLEALCQRLSLVRSVNDKRMLGVGRVERAGQHEQFLPTAIRAEEQGRTCARAIAAETFSRGRALADPDAAVDVRRLER